ncbi:MAG TPA: hypothetical protein VLA00_15815 [Xanthobacteraceae bacterium]|nr:hypothetical protein [Xanthobacteraceae bacterium]
MDDTDIGQLIGLTEPAGRAAWLGRCERCFLDAAEAEQPIFNAATGLRMLVVYERHGGFGAPPLLIQRIVAAIQAATPIVCLSVNCSRTEIRIGRGMAAACGLTGLLAVTTPAEAQERASYGQALDQLDYTAALASELDAIFHRQQIEARGNVLHRSALARLAMLDPSPSQALH